MRLQTAFRHGILAACLALPAAAASGQDVRVGGLRLTGAWARPIPPGAPAGAGYLTIANRGTAADRLLGGSSPAFDRIEVHEMTLTGGVMRMRPVAGGIPIPAGRSIELAPGGFHIMLIGPRQRLVAGGTVAVTLRFQRAGSVKVNFNIRMMPPETAASEKL